MASTPHRPLPDNPSAEHLRKQAKRLAKELHIQLAAAQHQLAQAYGYKSWAALLQAVKDAEPVSPRSELGAAAARGDLGAIRTLLARGDAADGHDGESPLQLACRADASDATRYEAAHLLLQAGANPRKQGDGGTTAMHEAAARGPRELVELLIRNGGLSYLADADGRTPLDHARAAKQTRIMHLLDRPVLDDARFKAAVFALQHGSVAALDRILDSYPALLHDRAIEPDCYPQDYFRAPKLFWFVAFNPTPTEPVPPEIVDIARSMIRRGVEPADLNYTLELTLTGATIRESGYQDALVATLLEAGAVLKPSMVIFALFEGATATVERLLQQNGLAVTAPIAAALDRRDDLKHLLPAASPSELHQSLGLAVFHRNLEAARICLDAGADANDFLPVHKHSTPLHQAALNDDVPMLQLLIERGARTDVKDTLWNGTPLGWAYHQKAKAALAFLKDATPA
ncbi:ankyrin repeat domain-containing protein [Roseiterribacter gracilis]|uniref:Ankyrin repeat domain-containing protein n=1 Tax=Roseiterribacter gracilis TaxID=2812848 RepID=A0A8S8X9E7_9PROT|nr:hypothetical protein TMPK1_04060 [Rhodospirillales bacterium TMPK1]